MLISKVIQVVSDYFKKIISSGLEYDQKHQEKIRLSNQFSLIVTAIISPYIFIYPIIQAEIASVYTIILVISFLLTPIFNYSGFTLFSRCWVLFLGNTSVFVFSNLVGPKAGLDIALLPLGIFSFIFFEKEERLYSILFLITSISVYFLMEFQVFSELIFRIELSEGLLRICRTSSFFSIFVVTFLTSLLFFKSRDRAHSELKAALQKLKASSEELIRAKSHAEKMNQLKTEFLSNISHELRNPLNSVIGISEILSQTKLSVDQSHYVDLVRNAGKSLLRIICDVIDLSKIESNQMAVDKRNFDLSRLIEDLAQIHAPNAQKKGLTFIYDFDPELPIQFVGDVQKIRQVIVNLITNAIKFTNHGKVEFTVEKDEIESIADNSILVKFTVKDSGVGISKEFHESIFQRFYQDDIQKKYNFTGSGLGLTISKQLIELLGGSISLESHVGVGSKFTVRLKLQLDKSEDNFYIGPPSGVEKLIYFILMENFSETKLLNDLLEKWGCEFYLFQNTLHLSDQLKISSERPRVLFVDEKIFEIEKIFFEKLVEKQKVQADLKIIVLKNIDTPIDLYPASDVITKPLTRNNVFICIQSLISEEYQSRDPVFENKELFPERIIKVLVAEDNRENQFILKTFIEQWGGEADIVENGKEVFNQFKKNKYDLILMDIQMRVIDGFEATSLIRNYEKHHHLVQTPILAVTALSLKEDLEKCLQVGCNNYITKPIDYELLYKSIKKYINKKNKKILIADDSEDNRLILKVMLEDFSDQIDFVRNGEEAIQTVLKNEYSLIFMDMKMPIVSGDKAVEKIRKLEKERNLEQSVIIAITGETDKSLLQHYIKIGCDNVLTKPFSMQEILPVLQNLNFQIPLEQNKVFLKSYLQ